MTAQTTERPALRIQETGWAKARRMKGKLMHTWVRPTDRSAPRPRHSEWNIVRGED